MFYYSKRSRRKIIRTDKCSHLKKTPKEFIGTFKTVDEAYKKGFRLCRHCNVIKKKYRLQEKEIRSFCEFNGMTAELEVDYISVKSLNSQWKIIPHSGAFLQLYHKNTYIRKGDSKSLIQGYHAQNIFRNDICDILAYIADHDTFRAKNPLCDAAVLTNYAILNGHSTVTESSPDKDACTKQNKKKKKKKDAGKINKSKRSSKEKEKRLKKAEKRSAIRNVYIIMDSLQLQRAAG